MGRPRPGLWAGIALNLALITLATILLNAGFLWMLYEGETVDRHTELTVATARTLRAQLEAFRGDGAAGWKRVIQAYRKADLPVEELWMVDSRLEVVGRATGAPPELPDAGLRQALYGRTAHVEMVGRFTGRPTVVVTEPVITGGAVVGALRLGMRWEGASFFGGRLSFLLFYTAFCGSVIAIFGYHLFRRRLLTPIQELQQATHRIAGGEFGHVVEIESARELEALSEALTRMSQSLAAYQARTAEQVASLESANAELRQVREELIRSEKLASVGRLAAGIAHEMGNPLTAVLGYTELLSSGLGDPALEADLLARSSRELERIQKIIRDLLDFARTGEGNPSAIAASDLIEEALGTVRHQPRFRDIDLEVEVEPALPPLLVEPDKLHQVLVNLLLNAGDAIDGRGRIRIGAARDGAAVRFSVGDDGPGFSEEDRGKIFDPFFTTKEPGRGTGLGLAICQRIVDGLGGTLLAGRSELGGALISFDVPAPGAP